MGELLLTSLLRHVLSALAGYLVLRGWLTEDVASNAVGQITGGLTIFLAAIWISLRTRYRDKLLRLIAGELPGGTTEGEVLEAYKQGYTPKNAPPMPPLFAYVAIAVLACGVTACGLRGGTPEARAARTAKNVVSTVVEIQKEVLDGYVKGEIPASFSDPFFARADDLLKAAEQIELRLRQYHAATSLELRVKSQAELEQALRDLETLARTVFNVDVPESLTKTVSSLAGRISDVIKRVRDEVQALRASHESWRPVIA